ncbi:MAG: TIGR03364 family FAD-dependent oxidoreductase [Deltaproteobacteria bacterium]|nr:TIGR03364 family FAD-dependent oxidoreductase [Deltaproteobacteria bacterium]
MRTEADFVVVGGGIVGLAVAWHAARSGKSVVLMERSTRSIGASIRNFGMVWPIGRVAGEDLDRAMRARGHWLTLSVDAGVDLRRCGSLHLAHHEDEAAVLAEFVAAPENAGRQVRMLDKPQTLEAAPIVRADGLLCALWSETECAVRPAQATGAIAAHLADDLAVDVRFGSAAASICGTAVTTADGSTVQAERVVVCSGSDFVSLYPGRFGSLPITACQLQMMRLGCAEPMAGAPGPHLAGGLTLLHYPAFAKCPSLARVRDRYLQSEPRFADAGIHVMAAYEGQRELIVGDSHRYERDCDQYRAEWIDELILDYLATMISVRARIVERWVGVYAKRTDGMGQWIHEFVDDRVELLNGFGGMGMTLALAAAEEVVNGRRGAAAVSSGA